MIRINLAPIKRAAQKDRSQKELFLGLLIVIIVGLMVWFFIESPHKEKMTELDSTVSRLQRENSDKAKKLKNFKKLKKAVEDAEKQQAVIAKLNNARATPAHLLYELSGLLTSTRNPTMTDAMIKDAKDNPNRELSQEWDARHVWITSFKEKGGQFVLKGGAQSDSDMTQLAFRLDASVYFHDVVPDGGTEVVDKDTGSSYYKFTILGKVAY